MWKILGLWLPKMTRTIVLNNKKVVYEEIKEKRKSFSLTVFPSSKVLLKMPKEASEKAKKGFLKRKLNWIAEQQNFFKQFKFKKQSFSSGSDILYLGRRYQLIVQKKNPEKICFAANKIMVQSTGDTADIIGIFLKRRAEYVFRDRLAACLKLFPNHITTEKNLKIRKMSKRWGSFLSSNEIVLNIDLIKAPKRCIDYVITHELCHFYHKQHNKDFFKLLQQKCPNYQNLKKELEIKLLG